MRSKRPRAPTVVTVPAEAPVETPPTEAEVAEESIKNQKSRRRGARRGTSVLSTMLQSRGGSSSTASRSGKLG